MKSPGFEPELPDLKASVQPQTHHLSPILLIILPKQELIYIKVFNLC
jgi:hypothetical protein